MPRRRWTARPGVAGPAAVALGGALLAVVVPAAPALAHHGYDVDCSDFRYQEDAQAHLLAHPGDPDRLDGSPRNGIACESPPRRPVTPPPPGTPPPPPPPLPTPPRAP